MLSTTSTNRLVQQTASAPAVAAGAPNDRLTFTYDYAGRRIQKTVSEWDGSGWMQKYSLNFLYDGWTTGASESSGEIPRLRDPKGETSRSERVNWNLAVEVAANGGPVLRSYVWGADLSEGDAAGGIGGLAFIRFPIENKTLAVAADGQGNTSTLYDMEDASLKATYEYGVFGEPLRASGPFAAVNPFRFSTKYENSETGWLGYTHRDYIPALGRWASQDPIGEEGGINLYGFVGNNPVNLVDPLGLVEWWNAWIPGQYSWEMAITSFRAGDPVMGVSHMSAYVGEVAFTLATFGAGSGAYQATRGTAVCSPSVVDKTPRLFHYTDSAGAAGIRATQRILIPGEAAGGKVWATTITPEQMFGRMGVFHRLRIGGGVNFEFGGPLGIRFAGTTRATRYFEVADPGGFSRAWFPEPYKGAMGQFVKEGAAAIK